MKIRLVLSTVISVLVVLGIGVMPRFAPAQASVSQQAAAAHAPSAAAMALVALQASTAATLAATATSTAATSAATPTATVVRATATATAKPAATATGVPLAAYPAPVTSAAATRVGGTLVFRWSIMTKKGVKGFNLYAGKHKLNVQLIKTHKSLSYHKTVSYRPGKPSIRVMMRSGGYVSILLP